MLQKMKAIVENLHSPRNTVSQQSVVGQLFGSAVTLEGHIFVQRELKTSIVLLGNNKVS